MSSDYDPDRDNPYIRSLSENISRYHAHNALVNQFNQLRKYVLIVLYAALIFCLYMAFTIATQPRPRYYPGAYASHERISTPQEPDYGPNSSTHYPTR